MNQIYRTILLILFFGLGIASFAKAASDAETLFQDAVIKETGERNPEAAVELYRQVILAGGNNHRLVARARLHMGNCLERMGKPKEAEEVYLQIVQDSAAALTEAAQAAQANLEKLEAQDKKVLEEAERVKQMKPKPMVMVKEFHATRFSGSGGLGLIKSGSDTSGSVELGLRYRLSTQKKPLAQFAEVGGFIPLSSSDIDQTKPFDAQPVDHASLKLRGQFHAAFIAELPHGTQRTYVPEIGAGAALTASKIEYSSVSSGSDSHAIWSPYFVGGLHLYPDRRVSFVIEGSYTANPYAKSVATSMPTHTQTFDFPTALWAISAQIQIKMGSTKTVLRAKE